MHIQSIPKFYYRHRRLNGNDVSLATGHSGLFALLCHAQDNGDIALSESSWLEIADIITEGYSRTHFPSLLSGAAGIPFVLKQRFSSNMLKLPEEVIRGWLRMVTQIPGRHELVSGTCGIGVLAAEFRNWGVVSSVVNYLLETTVKTKFGISWKNPSRYSELLLHSDQPCNQLNLGIAHGILGPMLFLTRPDVAKHVNVRRKKINPLLRTLDRILLEYLETPVPPYLPPDKESIGEPSPTGWCYGDLSLGFAAVKIGTRLGIKSFIHSGSKIAIRGLRRNHKDARTQELNLCHGHGSNVLMADRLYRLTQDERFHALHLYWKAESLKAIGDLKPNQLLASYRGYNRGLLYSPMGVYVAVNESPRLRRKKWDQFLMTEVD